ncbi:cytochrome c3 family protein [Aureibacter tunicatorum]|uniref:Nitrate/TMAO reductase-like tetraheme cytochrome c subunit n=1 Tax=Aureibacter tunicatorum TaxID=866807 RepID=A0AAE4BNY5_9BACT|nr:cytochrome c3 family protein [Aureibacter tunicatorum]MDR6237354.1 nitrate/TMAO reductase-like tetraheme cytochrome c subunit [Aureibacter tunicatorum]
MKNIAIALLALTPLFILSSCGHGSKHQNGVVEKVVEKGKSYNGISISSEDHLAEENLIEIKVAGMSFMIPERKSKIKSFACGDCHSKPLEELKSNEEGFKKAHWDIKLDHASSSTMDCMSCHDDKDMNHLKTLTGQQVDFNRSDRSCQQCHSQQHSDWVGGAHGKRIKSWASPRASKTCVSCHDPHKPHIESRWPSRYNTNNAE